MARRNWSFRRGGEAFKPHFNHAVGEYVESDKQFRDALKRSGNTPIYPGDLQPTGDTQALEDQSRSWHNLKAKGDPRAFSQ